MAALKVIKGDVDQLSPGFIKLVKHEAEMMRQLDHKNLVRLYDCYDRAELKSPNGTKRSVFYMALELCSGGELFDFIA
jgi:serine/threonine protein kinase